ncbi:tail fiber assembly protein [Ewingella americana]|uniref:tail fiber assembly protein n=1 Tax=Ewingella americana TaxID=41202 RepID=UPI0012AD90EE|nr:tail fiber assembly protein [Ewingella americana]MRT01868.1 phage tail protein [Ewingella americana]
MYYYSPKNNAFYPKEFEEDYLQAGSFPDDVVEVGDEVFLEFSSNPAPGRVRIAGKDGKPAWADAPKPTKEQLITFSESVKASKISGAKQTISIWQSELLLGEISDEDKGKLTEWISYIKDLQKVDTSNPSKIIWPTEPEA